MCYKMKTIALFLSTCVSVVIVCSAWLYQEPPEDYVPSKELCWEHQRECTLYSGGGSGLEDPKCWKRCVCRGFQYGKCVVAQDCKRDTPTRPWKCGCIASANEQDDPKWLRSRMCGRW